MAVLGVAGICLSISLSFSLDRQVAVNLSTQQFHREISCDGCVELLREYVQRFQDPSSKATDWWILLEPLAVDPQPAVKEYGRGNRW